MYREFKVQFTHNQALRILHGKSVRLSAAQLNKGPAHYFGVENHKKLVKAFEHDKGCTLSMTHGEVLRTHQSGLDGSGFWGDLWNGIKKGASSVWGFLKDNWKPITSGVLDVGTAIYPDAAPARQSIKAMTGLGVQPAAELPEMVEATPRRRRRTAGGSFKLTGT